MNAIRPISTNNSYSNGNFVVDRSKICDICVIYQPANIARSISRCKTRILLINIIFHYSYSSWALTLICCFNNNNFYPRGIWWKLERCERSNFQSTEYRLPNSHKTLLNIWFLHFHGNTWCWMRVENGMLTNDIYTWRKVQYMSEKNQNSNIYEAGANSMWQCADDNSRQDRWAISIIIRIENKNEFSPQIVSSSQKQMCIHWECSRSRTLIEPIHKVKIPINQISKQA